MCNTELAQKETKKQSWSSGMPQLLREEEGEEECEAKPALLSCVHSLCPASCPGNPGIALLRAADLLLTCSRAGGHGSISPSFPPAPVTLRASDKMSHLLWAVPPGAETLQRWPQTKAERLLAENGECGSETNLATSLTYNEIYLGAADWFFCMFLEQYHLPFTQGS